MKKKKQKLIKELSDTRAIQMCARRFGLLGDETRMKICWLLCTHKELTVTEIAELLDVSVSVVSHSLRRLRDQNMVTSRREQTSMYYRFMDESMRTFLHNQLSA